MAVVMNPYSLHQSQLGVLETGLKSLKTDKHLMSDSEFSDMYWAVERHHRDLKLAHLTGKAKDLMEQAQRDTKFYNILIKMLCEVKRLPNERQRESLKKVHLWYKGNRHTLATGPRFGKAAQKADASDAFIGVKTVISRTPSAKRTNTSKSNPALSSRSYKSDPKTTSDFRQHISTEHHDEASTPRGFAESMNPPSEPASSRMSHLGANDFMTNRFLMDLPSSKLSWHIESPTGKSPYDNLQTPISWEGPDSERVGDSSLSQALFDGHYHKHHTSVPNSSPHSGFGDDSPRSDTDNGGSSCVGMGSTDMVDFHSDFRSLRSRRKVSAAGTGQNDMSEDQDQSSSSMYGLPRKMVHSIASLVNPHAKMAENEALRAEQEYKRGQSATPLSRAVSSSTVRTPNRGQSGKGAVDLSAHIPVLRAVSVNSRSDGANDFTAFRKDHLYGQDILNLSRNILRSSSPLIMPPIEQGKLNFVGRSGTALDVRYSAHAAGDMPETHTREVVQLYSMQADSKSPSNAVKSETLIHHQKLEDFYQTAESYYPQNLPKYRNSRIQSAPAPRVKSAAKTAKTNRTSFAKTAVAKDRKQPGTMTTKVTVPVTKSTQQQNKLGKQLLDIGEKKEDEEDEILYKAGSSRPASAMKLDTVVNMIDSVKDEMTFFREKLAPSPMPGFRQPASTGVSSKPLSRPTSTTSHRSRPSTGTSKGRVVRSPSPQGRPSTPTDETENLMMGEPEVPYDRFKPATQPARPHSATVSKAVDWRGKVTPEAARIRSKNRFGGHTYVQKLKPSLRTAGATSAGKRPKTAPMAMKQRWGTKDKNYPSIVTKPDYPYPITHHKDKPKPLITITECDKNQRIAQAASNTVTQIDDTDMDKIMNIQYILGSSEPRYGSMGSLFLDEEFLRSLNARYTANSSMSQYTTGSLNQNKEFLSFVGPSPRLTPSESRAVSRSALRRTDIHQIPEEATVREEDSNFVNTDNYYEGTQLEEHKNEYEEPDPPADITETQTQDQDIINDTPPTVEPLDLTEPEVKDTVEVTQTEEAEVTRPEEVKFGREVVQVETEDREGDIHIEVTAIPASGRPLTQPGEVIQGLSKSEGWNYQPDGNDHEQFVEGNQKDDQDLDDRAFIVVEGQDGTQLQRYQQDQHYQHHKQQHNLQQQQQQQQQQQRQQQQQQDQYSEHQHTHVKRPPHFHEHGAPPGAWSKSIVKPENYCFHCLPDNMSTKVGRSAGRMPGGSQTPAGQVLRMSRRQNEYFKKAPPVRTPPSIPSPHHPLGGRSPRQGQQYSSEHEHHAHTVKSPRHYMEQVVELRKDNCKSAPPTTRTDSEDIMGSMSVISLRVPERAQTAPLTHHLNSSEHIHGLSTHREEHEGQDQGPSLRREITVIPTARKPATGPVGLAHIGRPIAQISHVPDPDELAEASRKQKEAKAAVDIQRLFRGYVCRNSYRKLLWENRADDEDKQLVLNTNQKELRKHQGRMVKIYNRPPLDPELLVWAKDFKSIQVSNNGRRQTKVDSTAQEMLANQQKAKSKIEVIGPHVEIYDIYHPKEVGPSKRDMHKAAVKIQKHARGFLVRRRFEKLRRKAIFCGSTWKQIVKDYKQQLVRVQRWHGVEKATTRFVLHEIHDYMDMRRRYESQFDKKSFGEELELSDLEAFFRECDLYPSKAEIDEGLDVITQGQSIKKGKGLMKKEAINLLFYIYVPKGTGLENTRQSTWMNPIIDGVEAKKLIGSEFVEAAPLKPCADLVIASMRERREKEEADKERLRQLERQKKGIKDEDEDEDNSDDSSLHGNWRLRKSSNTAAQKRGSMTSKKGSISGTSGTKTKK